MNRKPHIAILLIAIAMITVSSVQAQILRVERQFSMNVPEGWSQIDSTGDYPYHFVDGNHTAEIWLYRSGILAEATIDDEVMLEAAVAQVIDGVLPEMQVPRLQRSSGYLEGDHASFVLDFLSEDTETGLEIYHRLKGVLYRLNDGSQALFTLWAKTRPSDFKRLEPSLERVMSSFEFVGERQGNVFPPASNRRGWYLAFLLAAMSALALYLTRIRQKRLKAAMQRDGNFWECNCGRLNHVSRPTCHRCGYERETVNN